MPLDYSTLSSLSASLDDITNRLGDLGRSAGEDDEALVELFEVERQLQTACRRLEKIVRKVGRG